jgi:hypothetical protein
MIKYTVELQEQQTASSSKLNPRFSMLPVLSPIKKRNNEPSEA